jgi:hypothetical protein
LKQAGGFGSPISFQEAEMRITMIEMMAEKKDPRYTEQSDYTLDMNKNKATVPAREGKTTETDNYQTGLNCRKPL